MSKKGVFLPPRLCSVCGRGIKVHGRCPVCQAARTRARKYNITFVQALLKPNHCLACGQEGPVFVDHDHKTGQFRGWLCHDCNAALGRVHDSLERLEMLKGYLEMARMMNL